MHQHEERNPLETAQQDALLRRAHLEQSNSFEKNIALSAPTLFRDLSDVIKCERNAIREALLLRFTQPQQECLEDLAGSLCPEIILELQPEFNIQVDLGRRIENTGALHVLRTLVSERPNLARSLSADPSEIVGSDISRLQAFYERVPAVAPAVYRLQQGLCCEHEARFLKGALAPYFRLQEKLPKDLSSRFKNLFNHVPEEYRGLSGHKLTQNEESFLDTLASIGVVRLSDPKQTEITHPGFTSSPAKDYSQLYAPSGTHAALHQTFERYGITPSVLLPTLLKVVKRVPCLSDTDIVFLVEALHGETAAAEECNRAVVGLTNRHTGELWKPREDAAMGYNLAICLRALEKVNTLNDPAAFERAYIQISDMLQAEENAWPTSDFRSDVGRVISKLYQSAKEAP